MKGFFKHYFGGLYRRLGEHHAFLLAGGLAFSFLVCTVPLVLVILAVFGKVLAASSIEQQIDVAIASLFPYTEYAAPLKAFLLTRFQEIVLHRNAAGYSGVFGLLLAATGLFSSMRTILNKIFKASTDKHLVAGKLRDFGMVLLVLAFFLISTTIFPVLEILNEVANKLLWLKPAKINGFIESLLPLLNFVIIGGIFFVLYYFIPYENLSYVAAFISSLFAAIFWEIAKELFGYYLTNVASLDRIYGAYIFAVVGMLWIYYSSLVLILGAEIGQLYRERLPPGESTIGIGIDPLNS
jgi:membrane protein